MVYFNGNSIAVPTIQAMAGYLFNPFFSVSIGAGAEPSSDDILYPVFADLRLYLNEKKNAPFFALDGGYSFDYYTDLGGFGSNYTNAAMAQLCFGGKYAVKKNLAVNYSIGYRLQSIYYYSGFSDAFSIVNGAILKVGVLF